MAHDVFISYASGDKAIADAVCAQLESKHRIRCWIAPRDITPGQSWAESIITALDTAKIMVLIFSSSANASMQIEREVERAVHKGINIIPLRVEDTQPTKTLEYFISAPHWLDALSLPLEQHIEKLAASVTALLARSGAVRAAVAAHPREEHMAAPIAGAPTESRRGGWVAPMAAGIVLGLLGVGAAYLFLARPALEQPAIAESAKVVDPPVTTPQVVPAATTSTAASASSNPATNPVKAPSTPAVSAATSTPPLASPKRAANVPAVAAVATKPNVYVDFVNPISEGNLVLNIDGHKTWTANLAPKPGKTADASGAEHKAEPTKTFTHSLTLPDGAHKVNVLLLRPDGTTRETKDLDLTVATGTPQTLKIRLSRFKRDIQLAAVTGAPTPTSQPPSKPPVVAAKRATTESGRDATTGAADTKSDLQSAKR